MSQSLSEREIEISEIDSVIKGFFESYKNSATPIDVSFRDLIPELKNIDRLTHLIHSYPAKLLTHIPYFFLNNNIFSQPGDLILDPFCGTGTVLLEAKVAGRNAIGADANPLARLIARVKTNEYQSEKLLEKLNELLELASTHEITVNFPHVVNIDYWFNKKNKLSLLTLLNVIKSINDETIQEFFLVCFSNLVKKVSYADPRVSVPVKLNLNRYVKGSVTYKQVKKRLKDLESLDVIAKFDSICKENISRFRTLKEKIHLNNGVVFSDIVSKDARNITVALDDNRKLPDGTVDLILTSPPYAGAQKYIRSSSLNLGWLELLGTNDLKHFEKLNIGRESYVKADLSLRKTHIESCDILISTIAAINPLRAQIVSNYILEMQDAIKESIRVLKNGGYFILIVGNNKVCDYEFNTQEYLTTFIESRGLTIVLKLIDDIKSYGLMTKRNKTADIISREWVLIFKK